MPKRLMVIAFLIVMFGSEGLILAQEGLLGQGLAQRLVWVKNVPGELGLSPSFRALSAGEAWGQAAIYASATDQAGQPAVKDLINQFKEQNGDKNIKSIFSDFIRFSGEVIDNIIALGKNIFKQIGELIK
ncbi:MAG: hypothetical protein V1845_01045 [bacterium]